MPCRMAEHGEPGLALPLHIAGAGVAAAIIGSLFVRTHEGASQAALLQASARSLVMHSPLRHIARLHSGELFE